MDNVKKVPEIRFKGFVEEWEETYLEKLGIAISGNGFPLKEQGGVLGTPYIKVSDMNGFSNDIFINKANNYVTKEQIIKNGWDKINGPSIVFAKVGAAIFLDRKRIVMEPFLIDNNMMSFTPIDGKNIYFLKLIFDNIKLASLVQTGALPSLSSKDIYNVKVSTPSLKEQTQIGTFFKNLDEKLEIEKEKHKKLIDFKKAMLDDMFPKYGEKVPKVRFKGFDDEWVSISLNEVCEVSNGNMDTQDADINGIYPFFIRSEEIMKSNKYLYDEEAILTPGEGKIGEIFHYINGKYTAHQRVYRLFNFNECITPTFLIYTLKNNFKVHALKNSSTATAPSIRKGTITGFSFTICFSEEQTLIGNFFKNLDEKIELSEQKIAKIENFKKAMLDKMFV